MSGWRLWPRVHYTNHRKLHGSMLSRRAFSSWFSIRRYWSGRIIIVSIRHHAFTFDFRRNVLDDLMGV